MEISELKLTAPKVDIEDTGLSQTDSKELAKQIQLLPYADMPRALTEALSLITLCNRTQIKSKQRAKVLSCFQPCFQTFAEQYRPKCGLGSSFIARVSEDEQHHFYQFTRELSFGYKLLLMQQGEEKTKPEEYARTIYLTILYLIHGLMQFYDTYKTQPAGTWGEVNRLFLYAESKELDHISIDKPPLDSASKNICDLYKQIMLIALVDPYHLGRGEIWILFQYLSRWVNKLQFTPFNNDKTNPGLHVNLTSNQNAQSNQLANNYKSTDNVRTLDYQRLLELIEQHLIDVKNDTPPEDIGFEKGLTHEFTKHILNTSSHLLSQRKDRKQERNRSLTSVQICWGLPKINAYLSQQPIDADHIRAAQMRNESESGTCIELNQKISADLSVGQLALVWPRSLNERNAPRLCVVRWVKQNNQAQPSLGLEYIHGTPHPCRICVVQQGMLEPTEKSAILVSEQKENKKHHSLIAGTGSLSLSENFKLQLASNKTYDVCSKRLINQSSMIDQYAFSKLS